MRGLPEDVVEGGHAAILDVQPRYPVDVSSGLIWLEGRWCDESPIRAERPGPPAAPESRP